MTGGCGERGCIVCIWLHLLSKNRRSPQTAKPAVRPGCCSLQPFIRSTQKRIPNIFAYLNSPSTLPACRAAHLLRLKYLSWRIKGGSSIKVWGKPTVSGSLPLPHQLSVTPAMPPSASRTSILRLINASQHGLCPCHGGGVSHSHHHNPVSALNQLRKFATPVQLPSDKEYAFEVRWEPIGNDSRRLNLI